MTKESKPVLDGDEAGECLERIELSPVSHYLSTGCTILDLAISDRLPGGFGGGRISHIYGAESTAKSVLAQEPLGCAQRLGGEAWLADAEFTFDRERSHLFGLDASKLHLCNPASIEDLFDKVITEAIKDRSLTSPPGAIAVDSLSALPSKTELEEQLSDTGYGTTRAKQLSRAFRSYIWRLNQANMALIFVDQTRDDISAPFKRQTVSGGKALLFYASTRIVLSVDSILRNEFKNPIGVAIKFKVEKNKIAPPFREGVFQLIFEWGIDDVATNLIWFKQHGESPSGPWYECCDKKVQGLDAAVAHIEKQELEGQLQQQVYAKWKQIYAPLDRKPRVR